MVGRTRCTCGDGISKTTGTAIDVPDVRPDWGLSVQPHSQGCRQRIEEALAMDIRVKNAKNRMQERGRRVESWHVDREDMSKRRKIDERAGSRP